MDRKKNWGKFNRKISKFSMSENLIKLQNVRLVIKDIYIHRY